MPSVKDVNSPADVAAGNADIGEHAVIQPVERFGRGVAALPLADRLEDVLHAYGFLVLSAAIAPKSSMARPRRSGFRSLLRCSVCRHSQGPKNCQGCTSGMRKGYGWAKGGRVGEPV